MFVDKIDNYNLDLSKIIIKGKDEKSDVILIKKEKNELVYAFLNNVAKLIKKNHENIKVMSNKINDISILEFENKVDFMNFINLNNLNDYIKEIEEEKTEEKGIIYISTYRMDKYKIINIRNENFLNQLKNLLAIKNEENYKINSFISFWGKKQLYFANVKHYFSQKLNEKNFSNQFLNYSKEENFNILVNQDILDLIKNKELPKQFIIK